MLAFRTMAQISRRVRLLDIVLELYSLSLSRRSVDAFSFVVLLRLLLEGDGAQGSLCFFSQRRLVPLDRRHPSRALPSSRRHVWKRRPYLLAKAPRSRGTPPRLHSTLRSRPDLWSVPLPSRPRQGAGGLSGPNKASRACRLRPPSTCRPNKKCAHRADYTRAWVYRHHPQTPLSSQEALGVPLSHSQDACRA